MQRVNTPKRFYIDHSTDDKIEVRYVSCQWPRKSDQATVEPRPSASQTERLFSAGRLVRGGLLRKR